MTITEFLEARISQDEEHARKLAETDRRPILSLANTINHPQRLLAECAAKRAIIAAHPAVLDSTFTDDPLGRSSCRTCDTGEDKTMYERLTVSWPCPTIAALAYVYSDHPDYKNEWELRKRSSF